MRVLRPSWAPRFAEAAGTRGNSADITRLRSERLRAAPTKVSFDFGQSHP